MKNISIVFISLFLFGNCGGHPDINLTIVFQRLNGLTLGAKILQQGKMIGQVNHIGYKDGTVFVKTSISADENLPRGSSFQIMNSAGENLPYINVFVYKGSTDFFMDGDTAAGTEAENNIVDKIKSAILRERDSILSDTGNSYNITRRSDSLLGLMKQNLSGRFIQPDAITIGKLTEIVNDLPTVIKLEKQIDSLSNHTRHISFVHFLFDNDTMEYEVTVAENNGYNFTTYFHFYIDAITMKVKNPDGK